MGLTSHEMRPVTVLLIPAQWLSSGLYFLVAAFVRATRYHPSYFYYAQRVFHPRLPMHWKLKLCID